MICSVCREIKPLLTKVGSAPQCETCRLDSERQVQRNDIVIKDEISFEDTSAEACNQNLEGTTYIKAEPVTMGETQDQAQLVGFSIGGASIEDTSPAEPYNQNFEGTTFIKSEPITMGETQDQAQLVGFSIGGASIEDTSPAETYNQNFEGTTYIKDEPVAMGETQDQAQLVGFSIGTASIEDTSLGETYNQNVEGTTYIKAEPVTMGETQDQAQLVCFSIEGASIEDTSPAETCNQNVEGTTYIKDEPVAMGETQDQAQLVDFTIGGTSLAIKSEIYDSDSVDSNQCDMDGEENTDETLSDIELKHEEIQIKDELPVEEPKDHNIDDKCAKPEKVNCNFCSYSCATRHIMKYHLIANHPSERLMGCSICGERYQGKTLYQQHLQEKHNGFEADCKICLEMFREPEEVKRHRKHCLGRLLFICKSCDKSYGSKESVLKHMNGQCSSAPTKVAAFIETRIKQLFFTCAICNDDRAFEKEPYWRHIKEIHDGHSIICKYCPTTFKSKDSRLRHIKFNCTVSDRVVRQDLKCPKCEKRFITQRKLDIHVKSAHSPVKCEICQVQCRNHFSLKYHMEKEHTQPNLWCPYCQKMFKVSSIYYHHLKTHRKSSRK